MTSAILERYERYLKYEKKASANTLSAYLRDLKQCNAYLQENGEVDVHLAQTGHLQSYIVHLQEIGKSKASIARFLACAKGFYEFLVSVDVRRENPAKELHVDAVERKVPEILTREEMERLLAQPDGMDAKGYRDRSMLSILYATGMRVGELLALDIGDVDLFGAVIHCGHGEKTRDIPLYQGAVKALTQYVGGVRPTLITDVGQEALFVNMNGQRMSRQGFWKLMKGYQEKAGIQKEITPQTLRHCFATHLLENGADMGAVQQLMGHANVSTTKQYHKMVSQHLKNVYQKTHPKA